MRRSRIRVGLLGLLLLVTFVFPLHRLRMMAVRTPAYSPYKCGTIPIKRLLSALASKRVCSSERGVHGRWRGPAVPPASRRSISSVAVPARLRGALTGIDGASSPVFPLRC